MSYDMKQLRQAIDRQIPEEHASDARLHEIFADTMERRPPRRARFSGLLTAAAAVIALLLTAVSVLPQAPGRDHVGGPLSGGASSAPRATVQPSPTAVTMPAELTVVEEDMSLYQSFYSPMWGKSMFPDEAEFEHVTIRRQENGSFVFEKEDGSEALPGQWEQAFAYFVTSGVGLVGDGEGMALLGKDGLITDFIYDSLEYIGSRVAFVSVKEDCEGYAPGLTPICIVDGTPLSDEHYDEIGYTGDSQTTLFMGVRRKMTETEDGGLIPDRILYTDVMDATGRVIIRCHELCHVSEGVLGVRMQETGGIMLVDMDGNPLYEGREFRMLGQRKNGLQIVRDNGLGVLDEAGNWLIEPGVYAGIRFGTEDTFIVTDYEDVTREINRQGEDVSSASLKFRMAAMKALRDVNSWLDQFGQLGKIILLAAAWLLLVRLGHAGKSGEMRHMLVTEAGWAALVFALLLISHREGGVVRLWPTVTDTSGANGMAWLYGVLSVAGLISMLGVWKWLRSPRRALIMGAAVLLLPWAFKCLCSDMSVKEWSILSAVVFSVYLVLAIILMKAGFARRFMEWLNTLDSLNEYGRWKRVVWYALTLAAVFNFASGVYLSGQGMGAMSSGTEILPGGGDAYDAAWMEEINGFYADYRASGLALDDYPHGGDWAAVQTALWMDQNDIDRVTGDMLYRLRVEGTLELKREGSAQMFFHADDPRVRFLAMSSPVAENDHICCDSVMLVAPSSDPAPAIYASVHVRQPQTDWIASQRYYEVELGAVLQDMGGAEGEGVSSVAVIGGADGPTSILVTGESEAVIGGADGPTGLLISGN